MQSNETWEKKGSLKWPRVWTTQPNRVCQAKLFLVVRLVANIVNIRRTTPCLLLNFKYRLANYFSIELQVFGCNYLLFRCFLDRQEGGQNYMISFLTKNNHILMGDQLTLWRLNKETWPSNFRSFFLIGVEELIVFL